jgi:hypothetical protein
MQLCKNAVKVRLFFVMMCCVLLGGFLFFDLRVADAADFSSIMARWSKEQTFREPDAIGPFEMKVTYYSAEYIQALIESEADKNLWTENEKDQYTYSLLRTLNLEETIPVHVEFKNYGPSMYLAPFDEQVSLWVGNKRLKPVDYDKRFNFRLQGERDGMIFFPRFDDKGKPYLEGVKTVKLSFSSAIHPYIRSSFVDFLWDVHRDDPQRLYAGRAAARLELDRLIKRIENLTAQRRDLESRLNAVNAELADINKRVDELQRQ